MNDRNHPTPHDVQTAVDDARRVREILADVADRIDRLPIYRSQPMTELVKRTTVSLAAWTHHGIYDTALIVDRDSAAMYAVLATLPPADTRTEYAQSLRNRLAAIDALTAVGLDSTRIVSVTRHDDSLIVAAQQPSDDTPYTVDVFRQPTDDETDPELHELDRRTPGTWLIQWQASADSAADVPQVVAHAVEILAGAR
ncbi:hypothetical protein [Streptomyces sp. NPDC051561]|uniref:hypothetical protein n=1 Tax=Streptomyces sp. NPDC051561 TaxID=3365658 RepID=UPI0037B43F1C